MVDGQHDAEQVDQDPDSIQHIVSVWALRKISILTFQRHSWERSSELSMYFTKISEHKKGKPSKLFPHVCSPEQGDMMAHPLQLQHLQQELH